MPRKAVPVDLSSLVTLEAVSFASPWSAALIEAELRHPEALVLVTDAPAGGAAGYAAFRFGPGEVELLRVAVAPAWRRRGLAASLVDSGLAAASARGAESCFLEVRAEKLAAIALYSRLGFAGIGRRAGYYADGGDALLMGRSLASAGARPSPG